MQLFRVFLVRCLHCYDVAVSLFFLQYGLAWNTMSESVSMLHHMIVLVCF